MMTMATVMMAMEMTAVKEERGHTTRELVRKAAPAVGVEGGRGRRAMDAVRRKRGGG